MSRAQRSVRRSDGSDWLDVAARAGLVAYGVVHLLIAWLAVQLAFGDREDSADSSGALQQLAEQPFGRVLVWAVALGMLMLVDLAGHRGGGRPPRRGRRQAHRQACRLGGQGGRLRCRRCQRGQGRQWCGLLLGEADRLPDVASHGASRGPARRRRRRADDRRHRRRRSRSAPGPRSTRKHLDAEGKSGSTGTAYLWFGKVGYAAKGVALGIVGGLFCYAAVTHESKESGGLDQASARGPRQAVRSGAARP